MQERVAVGFRCSHCDRPLPLRKTGIVTCASCGGENYVELPASATAPAGAGRLLVGAALGAAFVMALIMVLGAAVLVWNRLRAVGAEDRRWVEAPPSPVAPSVPVVTSWPASPPVPGAHPAAGIVSWVGSGNAEPPCLADVDGDGVLDVIGFGTALMAVGAVSGEILWQSPAESQTSGGLVCDGRGGVVLSGAKDFSIHGVDPRTGILRWSVKLPDAPKSVSFGDGCVVATAIDDSRTSLALVTGTPAPCPSALPVKPRRDRDRAPLGAAGLQLSFSTVAKGSPRVVVRGATGAATAWEATLAIAADPPDPPPHALSAAGLVIAGKPPGSEVLGVVLLDPATGKVLASREIVQKENHGGTFFMRVVTTDRHAFVQTFGKLYALRLPELEVLWEAGSMW